MTLRHHPITGDPILFAPQRAGRPRAFGEASVERCPFCPGHESDTPPEVVRLGGDPWRVRVFPNKYPPIEGAEVIVESPEHDAQFESLAHADEIVRVYVDRLRAHEDTAYVSLFKNDGARAGASIDHVHSQLVPLPFVPPRIARESDAFAAAPHCPLCVMEGIVIDETQNFAWLAPHGSTMPYQQWLLPKRHVNDCTRLTEDELDDLAHLLRSAAGATRNFGDALNWMFMSFPQNAAAHFYVELFPRLATIAGFELGTGTFVEIIDPAAAARRLRET